MLHKAESWVTMPGNNATLNHVALRCVRNIARWWLVEHFERRRGDDRISFPDEVAMQRRLMPLVIWLGVREYGGIWRRGGDKGMLDDTKLMGFPFDAARCLRTLAPPAV
jgi:hypothetical protein